jgi:aspartyl-tRNA(Asn)/glutamyl-tRNA(Gln) amidotransferase subunit A
MPTTRPALRELLAASAEARRYPYTDRAAFWEERLLIHVKDLANLFDTPVDGDMLTLPPKAKLEIVPPGPLVEPDAQSDDPCAASAVEIAARVRGGALSPVDVAKAVLARAEEHRRLNAFITLRPEQVLREAQALEKRIAAGEDVGALAGVPVGIKDLMHVQGYPLTCGTKAMAGKTSARDAEVVAKLRAAGALIVGTLNLHELAYGVTSANAHFGPVVNPVAPEHIPGGSSGGSGATVATGIAAIAVGTDTGGSIRIPAACCGVVGFKPSHDAVSREGVWPLAWTLDHIGPLARSVDDAALGFEVMAGLPPGCVSGKRLEQPRLVKPTPFFFEHLDPIIARHIDNVLSRLTGAGATLATRKVDGAEQAPTAQFITIATEACQANWDLLIKRPEGISPEVRLRIEIGQFIGGVDYVKAQRLRRALRDAMIAALKDADVFVLPSLPISLPKTGTTMAEIAGRVLPVPTAVTRLTSPFNFSGLPAISIPCGSDRNGLPVGLQLVGRPGADATVLAAARWCEQVLAAGS